MLTMIFHSMCHTKSLHVFITGLQHIEASLTVEEMLLCGDLLLIRNYVLHVTLWDINSSAIKFISEIKR